MKRSHLCALLRRPLTEKLSIASYSPLCLTALFPPDCYQRVRQGQESDTASLEELLLLSRCCVVLLLLRSGTRRHCSMADTSLSGGGVLFSSEELACFFFPESRWIFCCALSLSPRFSTCLARRLRSSRSIHSQRLAQGGAARARLLLRLLTFAAFTSNEVLELQLDLQLYQGPVSRGIFSYKIY